LAVRQHPTHVSRLGSRDLGHVSCDGCACLRRATARREQNMTQVCVLSRSFPAPAPCPPRRSSAPSAQPRPTWRSLACWATFGAGPRQRSSNSRACSRQPLLKPCVQPSPAPAPPSSHLPPPPAGSIFVFLIIMTATAGIGHDEEGAEGFKPPPGPQLRPSVSAARPQPLTAPKLHMPAHTSAH
jgi:hypothetical protein